MTKYYCSDGIIRINYYVRITDVLANIWTEHFLNTSLVRYHYTNLLGKPAYSVN
jgi:hypothetical protein